MTSAEEVIDRLLSALGNPLRRDVLRSLIEAGTPMSPKELAAYHRVDLRAMSHHVKTLLAVDGVRLVSTSPSGGSLQHFYVPGAACSRPLVLEAIGIGVATRIRFEGRSVRR
jgi:DNA-binding transcriptional ArsR family regulator